MAITTILFDGATPGASYTWPGGDGWSSGGAFYGTTDASAAFHGALGLTIPNLNNDYLGIITHSAVTKLDLIYYLSVGAVPSVEAWAGALVRYDASNTAGQFFINSAGAFRFRTKGSITKWTAASAVTANTYYRCAMHLEAGIDATSGVGRAAYFLGDDTTAQGDSGTLSGIDIAGTAAVLASTRLGIYGASNCGGGKLDSLQIRTNTDATGDFSPYTPAAASPVGVMSALPGGNWTLAGSGVYTKAQALNDASDTTYTLSPGLTTNEVDPYRLAPITVTGSMSWTFRMQIPAGSSATQAKVDILEGSTVRATRTFTLTSSWADYQVALTPTEKATITDATKLRANVYGNPA